MDESTEGQYDMIIVRDIITETGIYLIFSNNTIACRKLLYQECTTHTVDLNEYVYDNLKEKIYTRNIN